MSMQDRKTGLLICVSAFVSLGATAQTDNFHVTAATVEIARSVAERAEESRKLVAETWLGESLPAWSSRCRVKVSVGETASQGLTSYELRDGRNGDWEMELEGPLVELLDSVIPHEVSHTIFASIFAQPLPRWADEGVAMLAETQSEQRRQRLFSSQIVESKRRAPLRGILNLKEYPRDSSEIMTIYSVGYSLSDYLVRSAGRQRYLEFLKRAEKEGWDKALQKTYGIDDIESLEVEWVRWVRGGYPRLKTLIKGRWVRQSSSQSANSKSSS